MGRITVTVDGVPYSLLPGAEASMLVDQLPDAQREALHRGLAVFVDRYGHEVGSGGGLADGQALRVVYLA